MGCEDWLPELFKIGDSAGEAGVNIVEVFACKSKAQCCTRVEELQDGAEDFNWHVGDDAVDERGRLVLLS